MKNLKHLFTVLLLLSVTTATAHDFEVGGIYYNILSETDKTVEVTYKGTSYSEYSNEYTGNVLIPETVTVLRTSTTVIATFDAWTSTNKGNGGTTSQTSYTLNVEAGQILKFDWSVSSESNYDWLTITLDGTEILKKSGTLSGSYENTFTTAGTHTLVVKYSKDGSDNKGDDEGKIYNLVLSAADSGVSEVAYSVTTIGISAFNDCTGLTSIKIPNSVTSIGNNAFYNCTGLTSIEIPNSVTSIGSNAFYNCTGLTSIEIPNSVTSIGYRAFYGCTGLTSVEIPNSVTSIGYRAFYGCTGLTSIKIPNGVTSIEYSAFESCTSLTSVTIPNSVTNIGSSAFKGCSNLTSIVIPNSVTSIEEYAFYGCSGLKEITIPSSVTSIGSSAFYNCTSLKTVVNFSVEISCFKGLLYDNGGVAYYADKVVNAPSGFVDGDFAWIENEEGMTLAGYLGDATDLTLPAEYNGKSVTSIHERMFYKCTGLTSVEIPNSVTSIGSSAFYACSGLTSIVIPNSVTSIGDYMFYNCSGLTSIEIPNCVTSIESYAFYGCTSLTSIEIPDNVTSIGDYAFYGCSLLADIDMPNSDTSIGEYAFYGTAWYNNQPDGVIYIGKYLHNYKGTMPENTSIIVKDGTLGILGSAFKNCSNLKSITIPNCVKSIGNSAFYKCSALSIIEIPNSVTSIGSWAFAYSGIRSIEIPDGVTSIEAGTFNECSYLTNVVIPNSVTSIGSSAFSDCYNLPSIEIPNNVKSIGDEAFLYCSRLTDVTIGDSVVSIGEDAFKHCERLTSITIPNSVTKIGDYAFWYCYDLASVTMGNGIKSVGYDAFRDCTDLSEVHITDVSAWCKISFESADSNPLTSARYLYMNGERVTELVIPEDATKYGVGNLSSCSGLTSITSLIPAENLFVITNAFYYVDKNACTLYVPYGAKETYASTEGWSEFTNIVELEKPVTEVTVTINQYGSATYCSEYALDFSEVEGLKAYAATGYKTNSQVVTLTRVQTAEAGIGLFLKGEPGEYVVPVIESTDEHSLNMFVGVLEETVVNSTEGNMSNYKFIISDVDNAPMFCPFEDNTTFSAGEAYLQIPTAWLPSVAQKSVSIRFDEGEFTDIDEVEGESGEVKTVYDLLGRVVENPTNGIYIINGKKVLVK